VPGDPGMRMAVRIQTTTLRLFPGSTFHGRAKTCGTWMYLQSRIRYPDSGIARGTPSGDLLDHWVCSECGIGKDTFEKME
jgi:rubredoxin